MIYIFRFIFVSKIVILPPIVLYFLQYEVWEFNTTSAQPNIRYLILFQLAADAGNLIPMTEAEKKRLDELLSDETDLLMVEVCLKQFSV